MIMLNMNVTLMMIGQCKISFSLRVSCGMVQSSCGLVQQGSMQRDRETLHRFCSLTLLTAWGRTSAICLMSPVLCPSNEDQGLFPTPSCCLWFPGLSPKETTLCQVRFCYLLISKGAHRVGHRHSQSQLYPLPVYQMLSPESRRSEGFRSWECSCKLSDLKLDKMLFSSPASPLPYSDQENPDMTVVHRTPMMIAPTLTVNQKS